MKQLQVYGDRFFEGDGTAGGGTTTTTITSENGKELSEETKKQLERLAHLEKENKELIFSRDKAKDAKRKEEEEKLKQQGELQKLLDAKEIELTGVKTKADAFDELWKTEIEEAKKILGDKWLDAYSNLPIAALRKTTQLFTTNKKVVGTDDGRSDTKGSITLTEAQKKDAYEKFPYVAKEKAEEYWYDVLVKTGKIKKG